MNRRTITASVLAAAALLAVTGCQKQNGITTGETVSFGVSVAGQSGAKAASGTRAVLYNSADDIQTDGSAFACSAYNSSKGASVFTGETVTYSSGKWSATKDYTWQPGETLKFHAVYPATAAGTGDGNAVIASGGTGIGITNYAVADNAASQIDLMLGYFTGNGQTSGVANIKFDHPFTAVRFKMGDLETFIPGFSGITSITISGVYTGGTLAKWNGGSTFTWTPASDTKTVTMNVSGTFTEGADIVGTDDNAKAFTLIPQNLSSKPATITVNYNATTPGSIVAAINSVPSSGDTWKSGKVYTYTINFKTMVLTIDDSGAVQTWATETVTDPVEADDKVN